jgi:hypothetical protein
MTRLAIPLLVLLCSCAYLQREPEPTGPSPDEVASRLLALTGTEASLGSWRSLASQRVQAYGKQLDAEKQVEIESALDRLFDPAPLREQLVAYLAGHLDAAAAQSVLRFFESELGLEVRKREATLSSPEGVAGLARFLQEWNPASASRMRTQLAYRLDRATRNSDDLVELNVVVARALAEGYMAETAEGDPEAAALASLDAQMEQMRSQILPGLRFQAVGAALYVYDDLPIRDFVRYVQFAESRSGRWFFATLGNGLSDVLRPPSFALGGELAHIAGTVEPADS